MAVHAPQYASRHALISVYATARASLFRRTLGWFIDYLTVMIPGGFLVGMAAVTVLPDLPAYLGESAGEAGWSNLVQSVTHGVRGGHGPAGPLTSALVLVPLMQFLFLSVLLGWRGRTFGQLLVDTRVRRLCKDFPAPRRGRLIRWAFGTTLVETGLTAVGLVVLIAGQLRLGVVILVCAVAAFWINAFVGLGPRRRTIVDRLCGVVLVRRPADAPANGAPVASLTPRDEEFAADLRVQALIEALAEAPIAPTVAPLIEAPAPSPALTRSTGVYQTYRPRETTYPLRVRRRSPIGP
jgi:hypothetical protein